MPIRTAESWMLRFASNRLAAERDDEQFELIGATLTDTDGTQGTGSTFTSDHGGGPSIKAAAFLAFSTARQTMSRRSTTGCFT